MVAVSDTVKSPRSQIDL
uniref:Uncharacterized protein n=1 Tax=Anguilla anguilla TaxID=7936 RepID=A0A0E9W1S2_ANGAN